MAIEIVDLPICENDGSFMVFPWLCKCLPEGISSNICYASVFFLNLVRFRLGECRLTKTASEAGDFFGAH